MYLLCYFLRLYHQQTNPKCCPNDASISAMKKLNIAEMDAAYIYK
jgi:hypothetical protein